MRVQEREVVRPVSEGGGDWLGRGRECCEGEGKVVVVHVRVVED